MAGTGDLSEVQLPTTQPSKTTVSVSFEILKEKVAKNNKCRLFPLWAEGLEKLEIPCNFLQVFSSWQNVWSCLKVRQRRRAGD